MLSKKLNEYSAAVFNQFIGVSQPSLKQVEGQMDTVEKKLAGVEIKAHDVSKKLNKLGPQQVSRLTKKIEELKDTMLANEIDTSETRSDTPEDE